jgi:hypothetical protein
MMALLLQFAQWKPSKSKELPTHYGRELYQNIIEMINNFKYSINKLAKTTEGTPKRRRTKCWK